MTAKELLTTIQLSGDKVTKNTEFLELAERDSDLFDKKFVNDYIKSQYSRLPTDFQNSHFYDIIDESFSVLRNIVLNFNINFDGQTIEPCDIPLFGTADFKEFNAFVETSDSEPVIVFNEGLLMFTQKLMEIYTIEHWLRARNKMTEQMEHLLTLNFFDIMFCFHLFSNAYYAIPLAWCNIEDLNDVGSPEKLYELESPFDEYIGEQDYMIFEYEISLSTYLWIAAHEYSHIILGHLKDNNDTTRLNLNEVEVDKIILNRKQEFDADLLGAIITLESDSSKFLANGIYFALTCLMLSSIGNSENLHSEYPPVKDRLNNIFNNIAVSSNYSLSNYMNVDAVFSRKYQDFEMLLHRIKENNISFSSIQEMQHYIYKIYPLEN